MILGQSMMRRYLLKWPVELEAAAKEAAQDQGVSLAAWIRGVLEAALKERSKP